jgi:hypothetical protein
LTNLSERGQKEQVVALGQEIDSILAEWAIVHHRAGAVGRPRYIFVNETEDHTHDLAFKMSLKLAEKRSGIENTLGLLRRLPSDQDDRAGRRGPLRALANRARSSRPPAKSRPPATRAPRVSSRSPLKA